MRSSADFRHDADRAARTGLEEAILCSSKTVEQLRRIITALLRDDKRALFTRLNSEKHALLADQFGAVLQYDTFSQTAFLNLPEEFGRSSSVLSNSVALVSGGTSDGPVLHEARRTLEYYGIRCGVFEDIGVAGLWRVLSVVDELRAHKLIIACAGMDAALPTVLAGLIDSVVIAVPTSVGYGVATGGSAALNSLLASCAPGLLIVNIDNGFGAACAAMKILNKCSQTPHNGL
jgi:NCAIR mutase (PurE)-related protein